MAIALMIGLMLLLPALGSAATGGDVIIADMVNGTVEYTAHEFYGSVLIRSGSTVDLAVKPDSGYKLKELTVKSKEYGETLAVSKVGDGAYTFVMPEDDAIVYAEFEPVSVSVRLQAEGTEYGAASLLINGAAAAGSGNPCDYPALPGDTVTVSAIPDVEKGGYVKEIKAVDDSVTLDAGHTFTMPGNSVSILVVFDAATFSVSTADTACAAVELDAAAALHKGDAVYAQILPAAGYEAVGLSYKYLENGNEVNKAAEPDAERTGSSGKPTFFFYMPGADVTVSPKTKLTVYQINTEVQNGEKGSVSVRVNGEAASEARMGDTVTVSASPAAYCKLSGLSAAWTAADGEHTASRIGEEAALTFSMPAADVRISVTFESILFRLNTADQTNNGIIKLEKKEYAYQEPVRLLVTADAGFEPDTVTYTYQQSGGMKSEAAVKISDETLPAGTYCYSFFMPGADTQVSAALKALQYSLSSGHSGKGAVQLEKQACAYGARAYVLVTPDAGYGINNVTYTYWINDEKTTGTAQPEAEQDAVPAGARRFSFVMPAADTQVFAVFEALSYRLSAEAGTGGSIAPEKTEYAYREQVHVLVTPDTGYRVDAVTCTYLEDGGEQTVAAAQAAAAGQYFFSMPAADVRVSASFARIAYPVTAGQAANGSAAPEQAEYGYQDPVRVWATPHRGYQPAEVTYTYRENGEEKRGTAARDTAQDGFCYTFSMPAADVQVYVTFADRLYSVCFPDYIANGRMQSEQPSYACGKRAYVLITPDAECSVLEVSCSYWENDVEIKKKAEMETTQDDALPAGTVRCSFVMPAADVTVEAVITRLFSVTAGQAVGGEVVLQVRRQRTGMDETLRVAAGETGSLAAETGDTVTVLAEPAPHHAVEDLYARHGKETFMKWDGEAPRLSFSMPVSDIEICVRFRREGYGVEAENSRGGSVEIAAGEYRYGDTVYLTAAPQAHCRIDSVICCYTEGGESKTIAPKPLQTYEDGSCRYSFIMPEADVTVSGVFAQIVCAVSFDANGGTGKMAADAVDEGAEYVLPACGFAAPEGQRFDGWLVGNARCAEGDTITVSADVTVSAVWKALTIPAPTETPKGTAIPEATATPAGEKTAAPSAEATPTPAPGTEAPSGTESTVTPVPATDAPPQPETDEPPANPTETPPGAAVSPTPQATVTVSPSAERTPAPGPGTQITPTPAPADAPTDAPLPSGQTPWPPQSLRLPGDVSGNGTVDIMDVIRLLKYVSGWKVPIELQNADVNGDGRVDIMDVIRLLKYVSNWDVNLV